MNTQAAPSARYSRGAVILHWLIAVLIVLNFVFAFMAEDKPREEALAIMANHKAIGILILLFTVLRVVWRLTHRPPAPLADLKPWELALSRVVHFLLYLFMLAVPLGGWATHSAWSGGQPVNLFGLIDWPGLPFAASKTLGETFGEMHEVGAFSMAALVVLHIAGALKHRIVDRNPDTLRRISIGA
ncbi:cytochrome b561 [Novosphingobium kunmingense]|uniref:Cytochrome b561 n=1 Tax=Novosphingobium kunmingense TaxID=1211806 RepID=A0A2N0I1N2_9SPHN|nr:cytochrome b [Novosphingobium kunmingense]PKB25095.1 cytochrome b561 [Novosphingobium kunmingense]